MDHPPPGQWSRRRLLATGIAGGLATTVGILVARNQIRHPHKDKRARPDGRARRLVLAAPGFSHDPVLLAARDQRVFEHYNLDIRYVPDIRSGRQALDSVAAGSADGAVAAALSWLPRLQSGLDGKLVCGLQAGSARLLIARHSPIRRIEDLHRRAVGITTLDSPDRLFFSIMMR